MIAVAKAGYRALAPDYRGYGLSDIPSKPDKTSFLDLVKDTASILDSLNISSKVFVVAKDFGAMVAYRSFAEKAEYQKQDPNELKVEAPALFIMGEKDYVFKFPGMEEYLKSGEVKNYVPNLEIIYLPEGSHFVHEQSPDEVNQLLLEFLNRNRSEIGSESSPAVIILHGFPEVWYTWRHQMIAVAKAGYRAVAPDYRGYGLSDIPAEPEQTSFVDLVKDTASILDHLNISKVTFYHFDFGARVAYRFALFYPEKVVGIITLGVPFMRPNRPTHHQLLPEGFYMRRWEPGRAEADFGRLDTKTVVKNIYILFSKSEIPIAPENQEIMDLVEPSTPLPSWFTEDDLAVYGALYEKSGFQTALQVPYRSFAEKVEYQKQDPDELKVEAPALFIMGERDYVFKFPGMEEYLKSGEVKNYVPNLEIIYLPEVAKAGDRAVAPDYRGYGLSDIPAEPEKTSFTDLVKDTASIIDHLNMSK
nr:putative epoxide hydrolase [Tanacetum cinerariifolium]